MCELHSFIVTRSAEVIDHPNELHHHSILSAQNRTELKYDDVLKPEFLLPIRELVGENDNPRYGVLLHNPFQDFDGKLKDRYRRSIDKYLEDQFGTRKKLVEYSEKNKQIILPKAEIFFREEVRDQVFSGEVTKEISRNYPAKIIRLTKEDIHKYGTWDTQLCDYGTMYRIMYIVRLPDGTNIMREAQFSRLCIKQNNLSRYVDRVVRTLYDYLLRTPHKVPDTSKEPIEVVTPYHQRNITMKKFKAGIEKPELLNTQWAGIGWN